MTDSQKKRATPAGGFSGNGRPGTHRFTTATAHHNRTSGVMPPSPAALTCDGAARKGMAKCSASFFPSSWTIRNSGVSSRSGLFAVVRGVKILQCCAGHVQRQLCLEGGRRHPALHIHTLGRIGAVNSGGHLRFFLNRLVICLLCVLLEGYCRALRPSESCRLYAGHCPRSREVRADAVMLR